MCKCTAVRARVPSKPPPSLRSSTHPFISAVTARILFLQAQSPAGASLVRLTSRSFAASAKQACCILTRKREIRGR